jgi:hypothetical protein
MAFFPHISHTLAMMTPSNNLFDVPRRLLAGQYAKNEFFTPVQPVCKVFFDVISLE